MEFLTFKEPVHFLDIGITQTEKISEPVNDILLLGQKDENVHNMGLISSMSSAENGGKGNFAPFIFIVSSNQYLYRVQKQWKGKENY